MATITFSATDPSDGVTVTRSTSSMPYVAAVFGVGVTWHKTFAAAYKAAASRQHTWKTGVTATVVPAIPTAINGKLPADFAKGGWGDIPEATLVALIEAKAAAKG